MRITNQMMINSTMADIQTNKNQLNTLDSQLSSEKKINKPSEDPIIAIRALRLRTSLNQVTQYLDKNIPDASAWLDTTEGALDEAYSILTDLYSYCTQGATDSYSSSERTTLASSLQNLKQAFYDEGNVDYAGRYCFTGYMTDTPLTYQSDEDAAGNDYIITQSFTREDLDTKTVYTGYYEASDIVNANVHNTEVSANDVHRVRLAYNEITAADEITYKDADGNDTSKKQSYEITLYNEDGLKTGTISVKLMDQSLTVTQQNNFNPNDDGQSVLDPTTGEILLTDSDYEKLYSSTSFDFTYEKSEFSKGDLNPIMYFDCKFNGEGAYNYYTNGVEYTKKSEDIEYNINFSQKLKVNTEASDAFSYNLGRDIDDLVTAVTNVTDLESQIEKVENMMAATTDETKLANLTTMKEQLTKQKELAEDKMTKAFENGIGAMQDYQQQVSLAKADVGNRKSRLNLTKSRLTEQKTNFTNLKSQNEDIDIEEVVVGYSSAQLVYNASLTAASKVVQQTLLDFL